MRLIDADALVETMKADEPEVWMHDDYMYGQHDQYLVDLTAVEAAPTVQGWISVKDRLPELGQQVLVYAVGKIDGFIGEHVYALCDRYIFRLFPSSPGIEEWSSPWQYFHTDYEITHWMPLPEPPKEGDVECA